MPVIKQLNVRHCVQRNAQGRTVVQQFSLSGLQHVLRGKTNDAPQTIDGVGGDGQLMVFFDKAGGVDQTADPGSVLNVAVPVGHFNPLGQLIVPFHVFGGVSVQPNVAFRVDPLHDGGFGGAQC